MTGFVHFVFYFGWQANAVRCFIFLVLKLFDQLFAYSCASFSHQTSPPDDSHQQRDWRVTESCLSARACQISLSMPIFQGARTHKASFNRIVDLCMFIAVCLLCHAFDSRVCFVLPGAPVNGMTMHHKPCPSFGGSRHLMTKAA